ncbi:MAG: copper-binding protein [Marinobacter sp.]|nr:copper-binding protein [Marinobacter sp.]
MSNMIRRYASPLYGRSVLFGIALFVAASINMAVAHERLSERNQIEGIINFVHAERFELVVDDSVYSMPEMFPVNDRVQTVRQVIQELKPGQVVRFTVTQMPDGRSQVVEMTTTVGQ